jgi:two-component system sensor histidine kinase KdpD
LASDLGADWSQLEADDPAKALMDFARSHQITQIVVGSSKRSRWQELKGGGSIVRRVLRLADAEDIDVHVIARRHVPDDPIDRAVHAGEDGIAES